MGINRELTMIRVLRRIEVVHVNYRGCSILAYCPEENIDSGLCLLPLGCLPERKACLGCPYTHELAIEAVEMMGNYLRDQYEP